MGASYPYELPDDPDLAAVARALEDAQLAGELWDAEWLLRYVSSELRSLVGFDDEEDLLYGALATIRNTRRPDVWRLDRTSRDGWRRLEVPFLRYDYEVAGLDLGAVAGSLAPVLTRIEPAEPPPAWALGLTTSFTDGQPIRVGRIVVRLNRREGGFAGSLCLYVGGGLRASVQALLSRGDSRMFERMAELAEPARRPAAVLFADLEASSVLSRRLSSLAYFRLIRELTTAIDAAVVDAGGIVGKHAGDGVFAFFLAEQLGGEAAAAGAAVAAGRAIAADARSLAGAEEPLNVNVGIHWGGTPVIGQVVTGGRLEVTALGDEVNQAARLQQTCSGGCALISKEVIERLDPATATGLGIDADRITYRLLGDLACAGEKARRDAGALPVAELDLRPVPQS